MPSFFEGLKRLATGQPVFRQGESEDGVEREPEPRPEVVQAEAGEPAVADATERAGIKIIPEVIIYRVEYRNNGANMQVTVLLQNRSEREVMVDKITILGATHGINRVLQSREQHQVPVFDGPRPNNHNYTNCELQYRDQQTGDYFSSIHHVEFQHEPDNTYVVRQIRFIPPVKDI